MRRAPLLGLAAALVALPAAGQLAPPTFPHIVVIVLDDVGVDQLSCYGEGADTANTPNICALADGGALFRNAWANPTCSPTRSTVQTGRYGFRTGVTFAGNVLPLAEVTLAEILPPALQGSGYATAAIGKWHLAGGNGSGPPSCPSNGNPQDQGYDHAAGALTNIGNYFNWCRRVNGVNGVCVAGGSVPECAAEPYATIVNVNDALDWIGQQSGPWFLWLAFNAPHSPYQAPPTQCPTGPCHGVVLPPGVDPGETCGSDPRPCYKAMLETLDTEVGRLLDALPADTAILVLGDNGSPGEVVEPPFDPTRAKFTVYEGGVNVPLILHAANVATPGTEVGALVNATDLFATVLDLAGATIPSTILHDAVSVVDVLAGSHAPRQFVFTEHLASTVPNFRKAAREDRYKTIRAPNIAGTNKIEFYDLVDDPFETVDLYDDLQPLLTPEQQEAFDGLQLVFDYLDGLVATCPATRSCGPVGSCQPLPVPTEGVEPIPVPIPECTFTDTGLTACGEPGTVLDCPLGTTIHLRKCPCQVILEPTLQARPLCFRTNLTLVCR